MFRGGFTQYGPEITTLLKQYPILNQNWHVYGEEFIISMKDVIGDGKLLDPWFRPFRDEDVKKSVTVDKPTRYVKVSTTVNSQPFMCNIYFNNLRESTIECNSCLGKHDCVECNKTHRKTLYYPGGFY